MDQLIEFYAADALSLSPGYPASAGKDAIEADLRQFFVEFALEREWELVDYKVVGNCVTRQGDWAEIRTPEAGGEPFVEDGRCVLGWEKINVEWMAASNCKNLLEPVRPQVG